MTANPPASLKYLRAWLHSLPGATDITGRLSRQMVADWLGTSLSTIKRWAVGINKITERGQRDLSALLTGLNEGTIRPMKVNNAWVLARVEAPAPPVPDSTATPRRATIAFDGPGGPTIQWGKP